MVQSRNRRKVECTENIVWTGVITDYIVWTGSLEMHEINRIVLSFFETHQETQLISNL